MELRRSTHRSVIGSALDPASAPALELSNITKRYGQTTALAGASLLVRVGTVHALLGENGAGKTTLMRVAYGMVRPDDGDIRIRGKRARFSTPAHAIAAGVGMVHQHFTLVPAMTVAENIALGGHGLLDRGAMVRCVEDLTVRTGFALDPHARVEDLPVGAQQRVEIAKALARDAAVLILDEPTAVLAPAEATDLLKWLRAYADEGRSAILITHKLGDALAVADDITVLRNGQCTFTGRATESTVPQLTSAMIGSAIQVSTSPHSHRGGEADAVITAEDITVVDSAGRTRVRAASLTVRAGERVGIAAVEGSGQRELLRALAGRVPVSTGRLVLPSIVGFVPEDRHGDALLLDGSLVENVALRGANQRRGLMPWAALRDATARLTKQFDVRAASGAQAARTLSGGNQQKLVLARELGATTTDQPSPRALVVENPTRGLDVQATAAVHERLREASERGAAVVLYSSDLDEVLALATRVAVMVNGSLIELPSDRRLIGEAMLGLLSASSSEADHPQ